MRDLNIDEINSVSGGEPSFGGALVAGAQGAATFGTVGASTGIWLGPAGAVGFGGAGIVIGFVGGVYTYFA